MTAEAATTTKEPMFSPLKRWRHEHCDQCGDRCLPSEKRFLACVLCDLEDAIRTNNDQTKQKGAYL